MAEVSSTLAAKSTQPSTPPREQASQAREQQNSNERERVQEKGNELRAKELSTVGRNITIAI